MPKKKHESLHTGRPKYPKQPPRHNERPKGDLTKEQVKEYVDTHPHTEPPFMEILWEDALNAAERNKEACKESGKNPRSASSYYFQMCSMSKYKKIASEMVDERINENMNERYKQIESAYFSEEDDDRDDAIHDFVKMQADSEYGQDERFSDVSDEVVAWIKLFNPLERSYLQRRYIQLYDTYEINEGADKVLLKRILSTEIELHRIDLKRANGQRINLLDEQKLQNQLTDLYESMKWTKKQRNAREDMAQNKFTIWLENMSKEGEFKPVKKHYESDEVDFLLETYISSAREMLS